MSLFSAKEEKNLTVKGMHCPKCVAKVQAALEDVDGVTAVEVSLEGESARVEGRGLVDAALVDAVVASGFEASIAS